MSTTAQRVRAQQLARSRAALEKRFAKYSPDQRRDPDGQFADEGKGGGRGGGPDLQTAASIGDLALNALIIGGSVYGLAGPAQAAGRVGAAGGRAALRRAAQLYTAARAKLRRTGKRDVSKYRADQARDDHGRFADEGKGGAGGGGSGGGLGRTAAAVGGLALAGAGAYALYRTGHLARAFQAAQAAWRNFGAGGAVAAGGAARARTAAAGARSTKPYNQLSRRQQLRREAAARNKAMAAGATKQEADAIVARLRASAAGTTAATGTAVATRGAGGAVTPYTTPLRPQGSPQLPQWAQPSLAMERARYVPQTAQQARDLAAAARREIAKLPPKASYEPAELTAHRRQLWAIRDQADKLADDLAHTAPRAPKPPTMLQRLTGKKRDTRVGKYSPDQRRDDGGRFADEGKGGGGGGLGRTAAAGAGLLAAGALATPQGRALAAAGLLRTAAGARAGNLAAMRAERAVIRREKDKLDARLRRMAAAATPSASRGSGLRAAVRRGVNRTQAGAYRADAAAERRIDRAVERLPLPARAREAVRNELRHGSSGPDPAGKLIEPPSWLLGLFH